MVAPASGSSLPKNASPKPYHWMVVAVEQPCDHTPICFPQASASQWGQEEEAPSPLRHMAIE